jgi:cytochrome P450
MSIAVAARPEERRLAPEPPGSFLLGHLRLMRNSPLPSLTRFAREYGDFVRLRFPGGKMGHLVSSPEWVKYVLAENQKNYDKETHGFSKLRSLLGRGLVTSEGDFWLRQRRLIQPAFHRQRLASFAQLMARDAAELADEWERHAGTHRPIDLARDMMRLTLRIVSETLLSRNLSGEADLVGNALTFAIHHVNSRITKLFDPPELVPTPDNLRYLGARAELDRVVMGVIEDRRRSGKDAGDLLSMLLAARDEETGEAMNDRQLRDEVMTLFLAGHETTANALTWTFYLLSSHPEISERLTREVHQVIGDRIPALEDLPRLDYVRMVVDEAMRLYPPVWMIVRRALQDDEIGGYHIPALSYVFVSPWIVQRSPQVWNDPERFDPERFHRDRLSAIPRYAHFPFGGGPRLCIGNNFALMEAQLILATLAGRFRPRLVPGTVVELDPQITLRPKNGLPMVVERAT